MTRYLAPVVSLALFVMICSLGQGTAEETSKAEPQAKEVPKASPAAATGERWPVGRTIYKSTELEKRIHAALAEPLTQEFFEVPLSEIVKLLEEKAKCSVVVDGAALTADGNSLESKFNGRARGRSLLHELRNLLADRRLKLVVRNDCIWITTPTAAELHTAIRLYQVHDLVVAPSDAYASKPQFDALVHLISGAIAPETWHGNGSSQGRIRAIEAPGVVALAINQTDEVHDAVERLLAQVRAARLDEVQRIQENAAQDASAETPSGERFQSESGLSLPPPAPTPRGKIIYPQPDGNAAIRKALNRPAKFQFAATLLDDVGREIEKQFGITVEFDRAALMADGVCSQTIITFSWRDGSLRNALRMMLDQRGLTYLSRDGALVITTLTAAETQTSAHLYQIHDLLRHDRSLIKRPADLESFVEIIRSLVAPESWIEGGYVGISKLEAPGLQIIAAETTEQVQGELEQFVGLIREAFEPKVYEAQRNRPIVVPPPPATPQPSSLNPGSVQGLGGGF